MMDHMAAHYGKQYAPNSRETVRRQSVHQFLAAGLILKNPDCPDRPINSGDTAYQVNRFALDVLRAYGSPAWDLDLARYKVRIEDLSARWERERQLARIPVVLPGGEPITLSPGGQNVLIAALVQDFCPIFTPGGRVLYIGDADQKLAKFEEGALRDLGITVDEHGKMPDLVVHDVDRNWLVLVEATTSHGPIDAKRYDELDELFEGSSAGLVFVTAFPDRRTFARFARDIAWETEVWLAASPSHLIHFDGEKLRGPYRSVE